MEAAPKSAQDEAKPAAPEGEASVNDSAADAPRSKRSPRSSWSQLSRPFAFAIAALVFFSMLGKSGIWDPYELDAAELSRRIAVNVFHTDALALPGPVNAMPTLSDLRMGELPFTSMALGFRLFGLRDWTGRLPLAVWGLVGVVVLYELLARLSGRKTALYGAVVLSTMPLYFMQARTMLGDIVTMSSFAIAFAGLVGALVDRARGTEDGPEIEGAATLAVKATWLVVGLVGLFAGYMSRGLLLGVATPALAAGAAWFTLRTAGPRPRLLRIEDVIGALSLLGGFIALGFAVNLLLKTSPEAPLPRGLALVLLKKAGVEATFDRTIRHLGHAIFPWSAFVPFAMGRLFRAPVELDQASRRRESGLRVALLVGSACALAVYMAITPWVQFVPFSGVALLAAIAAVAIADFDRGAPPSRTLALGVLLFAFVLYRDMVLEPARALSVFEVDKPSFPKSFEDGAASTMRLAVFAFASLVALAWFEAKRDVGASSLGRWAEELWQNYRKGLSELMSLWNGNIFFALVVVEAALVGLGAMLFLGTRLGWASVLKLPQNFVGAGLNLWWALPLGCAVLPIFLIALRDAVVSVLASSGLPRGAVMLLAALTTGSILSFGYFPALAAQLSPKEVFDAYSRLQKANEPLGLLGVRARTIAYYHQGGEVASFNDPAQAFGWLTEGTDRRWLITKADDLPKLNSLHREKLGRNLSVLDARSSQIMLVSNQLGGLRNDNPLGAIVLDDPPPPAMPLDVGLEDQLDIVGWEIRDLDGVVVDSVIPQRKYHIRFFFRVKKPIGGSWKAFLHIDGFQRRYNGDHAVLDGKYAINLWQTNDVIVDDYVFELEPNFTPGAYNVYFGLFSGDTRMKVTRGPNHENRVLAGALQVR